MAMTDGDALLKAISANPDEDTPRLAYADWLTEHDEHDRAEFIRIQVEIERIPDDVAYPHPADDLAELERKRLLIRNETELLARYRDKWLKCPCQTCKGHGHGHYGLEETYWECDTCDGTGDLMKRRATVMDDDYDADDAVFRPHEFRRGFLDAVTLPMTGPGGAFEPYIVPHDTDTITRWRSTPLARGLVAAFPTITRVRMNGTEPSEWSQRPERKPVWCWFDHREHTAQLPDNILGPLYDALDLPEQPGNSSQSRAKWAYTAEAAHDALAVAALKLVKEIAK